MSIKMQSARFEMKYIVQDEQVDDIRRYLLSKLVMDENNSPDRPQGYPVCSLYLDSPSLYLYGQTLQGSKNRFKLRMRFYDDDQSGPAFLEIKRRETEIIRKKRAACTRLGALQVLKGAHPHRSMLFKNRDSDFDSLKAFSRLSRDINAGPACYVVYDREAFVSPGSDHIRCTFDRNLYGGIYYPGDSLIVPKTGATPYLGGTVLEMKFTDRYPNWMPDIARIFNLQKTSVPKYILCMDSLRLSKAGKQGVSGVEHSQHSVADQGVYIRDRLDLLLAHFNVNRLEVRELSVDGLTTRLISMADSEQVRGELKKLKEEARVAGVANSRVASIFE